MEVSSEIINSVPVVNDIQLTATLPHEMVAAQQQLIDWCNNKLAALRLEEKELEEAVAHAKKSKWKYSTLQNQYYKAVKRITYYQKVRLALLEGYYIVPNFPIQMFAIRTNREEPLRMFSSGYWDGKTQNAQELPENEGEYKNPFPLVERRSSYKDSEGNTVEAKSYAKYWDDEIDFPVTMAKPLIMEATSRAMALKIFDKIGIMPATKNDDPVIIGQIFRKSGYNTKTVSFMIAWHLNTNVL